MTKISQVAITTLGENKWVNVDFDGQDVQFTIIHTEKQDSEIKDMVAMAFSICKNFDEIINHCDLNGISMILDGIDI